MTPLQDFESRVERTVKAFALASPSQRVGVALSGDDSYGVLLYLTRTMPAANLVALTVKESDETSRSEDVALCRDIAAELGVAHHVLAFNDLFGLSLEELAARAQSPVSGPPLPVCALCIGLRNDALALAAASMGLDVLADGYNADDWGGNLMRHFLFGPSTFRPLELATDMPFAVKRQEGRVLKISPFSFIRKRDIQDYVDDYHPRVFPPYKCPHAGLLQRNEIRQVMGLIDGLWADAVVGLVGRGLESRADRRACDRCGILAPANPAADLCRVCWAVDNVGLRAPRSPIEGRRSH